MKIKNLGLSERVILKIAQDISRKFTLPAYEQFLVDVDLLSYNPDDYSRFNKIDYIRDTLVELDERILVELQNKNVLSDETKEILHQDDEEIEISTEKPEKVIVQEESANEGKKIEHGKNSRREIGETTDQISNKSKKSSLVLFIISFVVIIFVVGLLWSIFPDSGVFITIIGASIFVFFVVVVLSLKHDEKISDNTFVSVISKITEVIEKVSPKN